MKQIVVWNAATKEIKSLVIGFHVMGITGLAWSPCGTMLASVGAEESHSLQIVNVATAAPVFRVRYSAY